MNRRALVSTTIFIFVSSSMVNAGIFTRYDESKSDQLKVVSRTMVLETNLDKKAELLRKAESLHSEISKNCQDIFNNYDRNLCFVGLRFANERIAIMRIEFSESLMKAGRFDEAKTVLQNIIISCSDGPLSSYAKKAEFLLESVKEKKEKVSSDYPNAEIEKLKLQLEIEKIKLEQEKARSKQ